MTRQIGHVVPSFPLEAVLEEGATNGDCKAEFRQSTEGRNLAAKLHTSNIYYPTPGRRIEEEEVGGGLEGLLNSGGPGPDPDPAHLGGGH